MTLILGSENFVGKLYDLSPSGFSWLEAWVQGAIRDTLEELTASSGCLTNKLSAFCVGFGFVLKLSIYEAYHFRFFGDRNFKDLYNMISYIIG